MPSDDYASIGGGGALRLKGAKVDKKKKKKKSKKTDLEKNLDADSGALVSKDKDPESKPEEPEDDDKPQYQKTESELKYEEFKKKRVCEMAQTVRTLLTIDRSYSRWPRAQLRGRNC